MSISAHEHFLTLQLRARKEKERRENVHNANGVKYMEWEMAACEQLAVTCKGLLIPFNEVENVDRAVVQIGETTWQQGRDNAIVALAERIKGFNPAKV